MEWTIGITDKDPKSWRKREPRWEDEKITVSNQHSYHQLMNKLCDTAVKKRRGEHHDNDYGINRHLWNLEIQSEKCFFKKKDDIIMAQHAGWLSSSSDDDSEDDEDDEDSFRGVLIVMPQEYIQNHKEIYPNSEDYTYVHSGDKISENFLPKGHIIKVTYDFGSTTTLYLKVLRVRHKAVNCLLEYFETESNVQGQMKDLKSVPAYHWSKEQQIDVAFPNYSKVFLGTYIPPVSSHNNNNNQQSQYTKSLIGSATLGLMAKLRSEKDTVFATIEDACCSQDLMFAGMTFKDINEFLTVAEQAWTPRTRGADPDKLHRYRYNGIARYLFPKDPEADETYDFVKDMAENDPWSDYCAKKLFYRLGRQEEEEEEGTTTGTVAAHEVSATNNNNNNKIADAAAGAGAFDFTKAFPKTTEQITCGKFRWFQYKKGILRVLVGRAISGHTDRDYESGQILRTWKQPFRSFHELLCAVEASWIYCGKPLTVNTELSYFDADLGPSNPGPKEPTCYGKAKDAVPICNTVNKKKFVTTMALTEEEDGTPILYSGHEDGYLTKWNLNDNTIIWTKKIYQGASDDYPTDKVEYGLKTTGGVAGISIRWSETQKRHRVYTWTHSYNINPFTEKVQPSKVKCWNGDDCSLVKEYVCDVGNDNKGKPANPTIAAVVFCRLLVNNNNWKHAMVVGLACQPGSVLNYNETYDNFDLEEAEANGEGNILPFFEYSGQPMETWRGHDHSIQALAVAIPDKYMLSLSMQFGTARPDAMILWDLTDPGVPLYRHEFWNPQRSLYNQQQYRLDGVAGISVSATTGDVLICCEYGDRVAAVTVEDEDGDPCLQLHGYGNIGNRYYEGDAFHGRMAMGCGSKYAVMINESKTDAWLFDIEGTKNNDKLDQREGNPRDFRPDNGDDDDDVDEDTGTNHTYAGREIAIGKVSFPSFGGNEECKNKMNKRRKLSFSFEGGFDTSSEREEARNLGEGGPIAVAMRGKWLVAGFFNGTIVRSPFLPDEPFDNHEEDQKKKKKKKKDSNTLACYSSVQFDDWHHPILESTLGDSDESESEDDESIEEEDESESEDD